MNEAYREQVRLMLDLLPFIADESIFALEGGTAINFFVRDMPRLSVARLTLVPQGDDMEVKVHCQRGAGHG